MNTSMAAGADGVAVICPVPCIQMHSLQAYLGPGSLIAFGSASTNFRETEMGSRVLIYVSSTGADRDAEARYLLAEGLAVTFEGLFAGRVSLAELRKHPERPMLPPTLIQNESRWPGFYLVRDLQPLTTAIPLSDLRWKGSGVRVSNPPRGPGLVTYAPVSAA